jgi:predicted enzyme related to lactoylglutathione lyase
MGRVGTLGSIALVLGACSERSSATPTEVPLFELHMAGVAVQDFPTSYAYYAKLFRFGPEPSTDWALLSDPAKPNMTVELFLGTLIPNPERAWGVDQAVRLGLVVDDFDAVRASLPDGSAPIGDEQPSPWGPQVELTAPERIRFSMVRSGELENVPDTPHVRFAEIKVHDLAAQQAFYRDRMGMAVTSATPERVILGQHPERPFLSLVPGGTVVSSNSGFDPYVAPHVPIGLSFETHDIRAAAQRLEDEHATLLTQPEHFDWGGTAFFVADADGNVVQVAQND